MSDKMTCPACNSYTSAILRAYEEGEPCPVCGVAAEVTRAVLDARKRGADAELNKRYVEAEIRAGRAESEVRSLRRHLDAIKRAVESATKDGAPMDELISFLRARLADDEQAANVCTPGHESWQAFPMEDIAGASVYDDQWRLLEGVWYTHNDSMSSDPAKTGPAYINTDRVMEHIARHDPARVLADVAAKRAIVDLHEYACAAWALDRDKPNPPTVHLGEQTMTTAVLRLLALPFADHPDFKPEWRRP